MIGRRLSLLAVAVFGTACGGSAGPAARAADPAAVARLPSALEDRVVLAAGPTAFAPALVTRFERSTGCTVSLVPRGTTQADLVEVAGDEAGRLALEDRITPIELGDVAGAGEIPARLVDPLALEAGGRAGVPYLWSAQVLVSLPGPAGAAPSDSLRIPFARRYAGRVAVPDTPASLAITARLFGSSDPFALDRDDLRAAADALAASPPAAYTSGLALRHALERGTVAIALASPADLIGLGASVERRIPREGTVGSERVLALGVAARHPGCARAFLAFVLQPASQSMLAAARVQWPVIRPTCDATRSAVCRSQTVALSKTLGRVAIAHAVAASSGLADAAEWQAAWARLGLRSLG